MSGGASRSWEHDRDTQHRTDPDPSATSASSAWRGFRTATSTTCVLAVRTGVPGPRSARRGDAPSPMGQRRRPRPEGRPGFVRVDTAHSGDRDREKGAYVINMVDEEAHYQQLAAVPRITEHFMAPVLEALVGAFLSHVRQYRGQRHQDRENVVVWGGARHYQDAGRRVRRNSGHEREHPGAQGPTRASEVSILHGLLPPDSRAARRTD